MKQPYNVHCISFLQEPGNAEVCWRLAKSFFLLASDDLLINPSNDGSDDQKDLMKKAFEAAEMAVEADKQCGEAFKWQSVLFLYSFF